MGTIIDPILSKVECLNWDPPEDTPLHIYAIFWEVLEGDEPGAFPPPNLHCFKLVQTELEPCVWEYLNTDFGWKVLVGVTPTQTWIDLQDTINPANHYFGRTLDLSPPHEYCTFSNIYQHEFGNYGYGGFAFIFWLDLVKWTVSALGMDHVNDVMLETFPIDESNMIIKLCSKTLTVNVKLKFSSE